MNKKELKNLWLQEEKIAHIHGWDFSHIDGRCIQEDLPWDYKEIVLNYLSDDKMLLDYDTGGGEFLLSLNHPYHNTAATEGYAPNVSLCKERLLPLGINFKECHNPSNVPFDDNEFDIIINRHGDLSAKETYRLLKNNGIFITEQVGCDNDRDLVEMVLPNTKVPFPDNSLQIQSKLFKDCGFKVIKGIETYKKIRFYDVRAFVWFAHIIEWEFPNFSVEKSFKELLKLQEVIDSKGYIEGTIHRFLLVLSK